MEAKGQKKPLFMKTYSRTPARNIQKPVASAVRPSSGSTQKWIHIPTGSPSVSEISKDSEDLDTLSENSTEQEFSFVPATIKRVEKKNKFSKQPCSTPLVNIGNLMASRHILRRNPSPYKQAKKPMSKFNRMALIQESDTDSTTTEDELKHRTSQIRQRRSSSSSSRENGSKIIAPHSRQSKRVRTPSLMVKGMGFDMLGVPLASSTALTNKLSPMSSQDTYSADASDSEDEDVSTSEDDDDDTLVAMDQEEDEKESIDDIEIMRDLPDSHVLSVQGRKIQMTPKSTLTPSKKRLYSIKSQLQSLSLQSNSSQGSKKQVSFALNSKDEEAEHQKSIQLPQLPAKASILKKAKHDSRSDMSSISFSSTLVACDDRKNRMISTPVKAKASKDKMIQLSFDVSAVQLPSYDVSDLVVQNVPDVTKQSNAASVKQCKMSDTKENIKPSSSLKCKPVPCVQPQADVIAKDPGFSESDVEPMSHCQPESTPRSQLKRSSPESHLPLKPSKRKMLMKGPEYVTTSTVPLHKSSSASRLHKRLEYQYPSSEIPECCITLIDKSTCCHDGVLIDRYVSPKTVLYKNIQQLPQDILEVYFG